MMLNVCQDLCNKIISYKIIVFYSFFTILWYFSLHCLQTYLLMSLLMKSIAIESNIAIFSKILATIDSSDPSMDAADYAIYISEKYNSELCALNVMDVGF